MKKLLFLSFFGLFLLACTTDEGDGAPFVTDVVMPPSSQLFAPGDEVTVDWTVDYQTQTVDSGSLSLIHISEPTRH